MILRLFFALYSTTAVAQAFDTFVWQTAAPGTYGSQTVNFNEFRSWPKIKEDMKVTLKPGSTVFSDAEFAVNPDRVSWFPTTKWSQQCERSDELPPLSGKLLHVTDSFGIVEVDQSADFCGRFFNSENKNRKLIFVRKADVATIVPRAQAGEDAKTEATTTAKGICEICKLAEKDEALRAMVKKAKENNVPTSPEKKKSEQERYLACYKTPYQDNYNRFYKKLFNVAAKAFQVSYTPGRKGSIKPIDISTYESIEGASMKNLPFMVKADEGVMKCVGLRESSWNPATISSTGAMGIGQQTESNVEHLNCLLNGCKQQRVKFKGGKPLLDKDNKPVLETYWSPKTAWAGALWDRYFLEAKKSFSHADWQRLMTNPKTGLPCTLGMSLKERDAPCPVNSIGAMALYHVVAELEMRSTSPMYKDSKDIRDFDTVTESLSFKITQGTTTNAGTGTTRKTIKKYSHPADWAKNIGAVSSRPNEVGPYARFISNCLTSGNMEPYFDTSRIKNYKKPNCYSDTISNSLGTEGVK